MRISIVLLVLCFVMVGLVFVNGCTGLTDIVDAFKADNADATIMPIDDDGDGHPDALGADLDGDGNVDEEVPGSREYFTQAGLFDTNVSDLMTHLGAAGIPIIGLVAFWWKKLRPTQRLATFWETVGRGVIASVQEVRTKGGLDAEALAKINATMHNAQKVIAGLEAAIADIKAGRVVPQ